MPTYLAGTWKGIAIGLALSLGLAGAVGVAEARDGDSPTSAGGASSTPAAAKIEAAKANAAEPAPKESPSSLEIENELQEMRDLLQAQSKQIEQLKDQIAANPTADSIAAAVASPVSAPLVPAAGIIAGSAANSASPSASAQGNDFDARLAKLDKEVSILSKLKFSGDLRLRFEPFWGGGADTAPAPQDRYRERYRLRFNVNTDITDDFAAGFSLASGDLGDPISTNSTETGFYTRKPIAVDKAFGLYHPHYFKAFTLTAGKFAYTWVRTELTWDNDLNPEGASEAFAWDWKERFIDHFGLVAFQTPLFEVSGGPDTYMAGGQIQTGWRLASPLKFTADVAYYDFQNADTIAQNQGQTPANGSATQGITNAGGGNFGFSASSLSNNFGVIDGKRVFASKYGIVDALARLDWDTGNERWPVYALLDFAQNTEACGNLEAFIVADVTPPTCDPHQRHGYWTELKAGQTKNKGDLLVGYTFARIERDAVLSAFDMSDLRQPTNVLEHRVEAYYQAYPHVQVGVTGLIGRQIVTAQSATPERWLKRWQFDTIFSF